VPAILSTWDFSSYAFNGGDSLARRFGKKTVTYPGLGSAWLSSVKHPSRTALAVEIAAFGPWSWHDRESDGVADESGTLYNDSKNVVSFVDGHVAYIKMHWSPGQEASFMYESPAGYDYQWSPD